ncbi:MAG: TonB-dependent receptor [Bacteroidia bacterium]|nr:TonB-dependent receptor [Bacteroidia bacterium]
MLKKTIILSSLLAVSQISFAQTDSLNAKNMQEFVVKGIKANVNLPITQTTLDRKQIEQKYYGADIPSLINATPSINGYSDNGMGIGYSFFRLRGMDQTRVNTTVNGIPVNDPENMGVYFNNFADLASSAESIQIQRGVGTSTNGVASFGGSVNILTKNLAPKQAATVNFGLGSFGSSRATLEYQSGMIKNKLAFYGRISNLQTNGYRNNSGAKITSYMFSAGYFWKKAVLKLNIFGGYAENNLAYIGIDANTLNSNRTFNPLVNGEKDAFKQTFYQLQYSYQINSRSNFTSSAYFVRGEAPKFQYYGNFANEYLNLPTYINGNDTQSFNNAMTSYRLNQYYVGAFANYQYKTGKWDLMANMHANAFRSEHFLEVQSIESYNPFFKPSQNAFFNIGYKNEISGNVKLNYSFTSKTDAFGDIQVRNVSFNYTPQLMEYRTIYGLNNDNLLVENMNWTFVNYRVGVKHQINKNLKVYAMFGRSNREPARVDYFKDEHPYSNIKQSDIKHETVNDYELGASFNNQKFAIHANLFYMDFENQIASTGSTNAYGVAINTNVGASVRQGIEIDGIWKLNKTIWFTHSSSFSQNTINSINLHYFDANTYAYTVITMKNVTATLSPSVIINQGIRLIPTNWFFAELNYRFVSMQYLDNSENKNVSIGDYNLMDLKLGFNLKQWIKYGEPSLSIQVNNLTDQLYTPSGAVQSYTNSIDSQGKTGTTPLFYAAATRNIFVGLTWKF